MSNFELMTKNKLSVYVVRKDSVKLSFRLDIECTKESANAMRHYLKVAERCYAQGRGVYSVTIDEIA